MVVTFTLVLDDMMTPITLISAVAVYFLGSPHDCRTVTKKSCL